MKETYWKTPTGITKTTTKEEYDQAERLGYKRYLTTKEFLASAPKESAPISTPQWEKEFDKKFVNPYLINQKLVDPREWWSVATQPEGVKDFIRQQLEKLIEDIPAKGLVRVEQPDDSIATIDIQELKAQLRKEFL